MSQALSYAEQSRYTLKIDRYISNTINKSRKNEYISNNSGFHGEIPMNEKLTNISEQDENVVIKYLLEIMRKHDIITDKEYQRVLYKYS